MGGTLSGIVPTGQQAMASSMSIAVASDQSTLPVSIVGGPDATATGTLQNDNDVVTIALAGHEGVGVSIPSASTLVGTLTPYLSSDGGVTFPEATLFFDPATENTSATLVTASGTGYEREIVLTGGATHALVQLHPVTSGSATATLKATLAAGLMPVHAADGEIVALGATADAAWSGSGSGGVVGILKAIWTRLRGGQATMANSLPVTLASDQSAVAQNQTQLGGAAIDVNSGSKSSGTQRVVLATDQPSLTNAQPANVSQVAGGAVPSAGVTGVLPVGGAAAAGANVSTAANPQILGGSDYGGTPVVRTAKIDSAGNQQHNVVQVGGTAVVTAGVSGLQAVGGNAASGATDAGNPVKIGGVYNSASPTPTSGQRVDLQMDAAGRAIVTQGSLIFGEDATYNRMMIEEALTATSITTQTTTTVKSGGGRLSKIVIPTPVANATVKIYDNTAASGTVLLDTITFPGTLLSSGPVTVQIGASFATGCTVVTAGATMAVDVYTI